MLSNADLSQRIKLKFSAVILEETEQFGQLSISIKKENVVPVLQFLRDEPELDFDYLMDLFGVDYLEMGGLERFAVIYNLFSMKHQHRLRIKAFVPESDLSLDSVQHLWPAANWAEREVYDMYGISFRNHPDLKRILCPDEFVGHPLRKDFPLKGIGYREDYEKITRETAQ